MPPRTRALFITELIVGALIIIGVVLVFVIKAPSARAPADDLATYVSSPLQVTFKYPAEWHVDPTYNGIPGIERFVGPDGYFRIDATNDPTKHPDRLVIRYPKPIKLGTTTYRYFKLIADPGHLQQIGNSVEFLK